MAEVGAEDSAATIDWSTTSRLSAVATWLLAIARNVAIDHARMR